MATIEKAYSHVGSLAYTGRYAVTADAIRTPGQTHALNPVDGRDDAFRSLCGRLVHRTSGDHFCQDEDQVHPAGSGRKVTCSACRKALFIRRHLVEIPRVVGRGWAPIKAAPEGFATKAEAEACLADRRLLHPRQAYRIRLA